MKKAILAVLAVTAGMMAVNASAQTTPWQVRARAVHIDPADKSDPLGGVGASDRLSVSKKTIPEVDISYFFTPNIAAELVLTYPQRHDVKLDGQKIGTFKHLPPSLLVQYHFMPEAQFSPYLGAGINWTTFSKNNILNNQASLEHDSFGLAVQAGVDFKLNKNWSLNLDVKKIQIRSDVMIGGVKASKVKVDPVLIGVGVGYRF
ncbi:MULTISPECIES: OmpW family protein [unclassified Massilia]|uniref:OmpW/AlkL family protein n=1 Tax=unclassified Massilia TaxID=2609279 RepID=UPI001594D67B|nr:MULTISPECIES: OmpW family outer membrane protein [unclassified Massilia]NVD96434.1 OmpW family protein [Massilia sp. BJB1822]UTY57442.1 OmpW family protein [Massilia sp. erpn]